MQNKLTPCNFCKYYVGHSCVAQKFNEIKTNPIYCRDAKNEYYLWLKTDKSKKRKK